MKSFLVIHQTHLHMHTQIDRIELEMTYIFHRYVPLPYVTVVTGIGFFPKWTQQMYWSNTTECSMPFQMAVNWIFIRVSPQQFHCVTLLKSERKWDKNEMKWNENDACIHISMIALIVKHVVWQRDIHWNHNWLEVLFLVEHLDTKQYVRCVYLCA